MANSRLQRSFVLSTVFSPLFLFYYNFFTPYPKYKGQVASLTPTTSLVECTTPGGVYQKTPTIMIGVLNDILLYLLLDLGEVSVSFSFSAFDLKQRKLAIFTHLLYPFLPPTNHPPSLTTFRSNDKMLQGWSSRGISGKGSSKLVCGWL